MFGSSKWLEGFDWAANREAHEREADRFLSAMMRGDTRELEDSADCLDLLEANAENARRRRI